MPGREKEVITGTIDWDTVKELLNMYVNGHTGFTDTITSIQRLGVAPAMAIRLTIKAKKHGN